MEKYLSIMRFKTSLIDGTNNVHKPIRWVSCYSREAQKKLIKTFIVILLATLFVLPTFIDAQSQTKTADDPLQKRVELLEQTTQKFASVSSYLSIFEIIIVVLSVLIGIVGLSLPLMVYFFQLRPAQQVLAKLDDFDDKLEDKLIEYLHNEEQKRINKAIDEVVNPDETVAYNAIQYLSFNQFFNFSDDQLFKVCTHLRSGLDSQKKAMLASILAKRQTDFADQYFQEIIRAHDFGNLVYPAISYFARVGIGVYVQDIAHFIRTANNASLNPMFIANNYFNVAVNVLNVSKTAFETLVNNPDLNNGLDQNIRRQIRGMLGNVVSNYSADAVLRNSLLVRGL
jgi:hypothetical protein